MLAPYHRCCIDACGFPVRHMRVRDPYFQPYVRSVARPRRETMRIPWGAKLCAYT